MAVETFQQLVTAAALWEKFRVSPVAKHFLLLLSDVLPFPPATAE